jgi:putative flippase GtrA
MSLPRPCAAQSWFGTLLRSSAVGVLATVADLGSLWVLVRGLSWSARAANVPTLIPGLAIQFFGNKFFAFRDYSPQLKRQGGLFLLVEAGAFLLNVAAFHLIVTLSALHYLAARMLGTGLVYLGFSFPLWGLIFRRARAEAFAVGLPTATAGGDRGGTGAA